MVLKIKRAQGLFLFVRTWVTKKYAKLVFIRKEIDMEKIEKMFIGTLVILLITLMIMNIVQMHNYDLLEKTNDKL